jgi:hypothetical protein
MGGMRKNLAGDGWNFRQDPGLDLYCDIEGVDRCTLLKHVNSEYSRRQAHPLHLYKATGRQAGFAAMLMLVIRFFSRH